MLNIARKFTRRRQRTSVEDNLRFYMGFSEQLVAFGFFSLIFHRKLNVQQYLGDEGLSVDRIADPEFWDAVPEFFANEWVNALFALFVLGWFVLYKAAVKSEMQLLVSLYSRINPPHDWEKTIGAKMVPLLSLGLTIAFFGLAWNIDNVPVFCLIMLLLSMQDAAGNNILRKNMVRHFLKREFDPHPSDLHKPFIMERRGVALEYWVWKPQIERVSFVMFGTLVAFLIAVEKTFFGWSLPPAFAPFIIMATITLNEITMSRWRIERDLALEEIEAKQDEHERKMSSEATA